MLACYEMGAELLELQHAKEEDWFDLQNRLRGETTEVWLGASDIKEEGKFVYVSTAEKVYYTQWVRRRLDNIGKNEHCLTYDVASKGMNDAKCDSRFAYACKK
ncbi:CD209 antigen-like [Saccostrea cucullata]|uniref:CD209 antigen-like n=1 Tax=Saccostrea cuccullata TaxID=36930 RepID=UPI002ED44F02